VNTAKARIAAIALLDRAFQNVTDDELAALAASLPEDHLSALRHIAGLRGHGHHEHGPDCDHDHDDATDEATDEAAADDPVDTAELVPALRTAAVKGRINGDLERISVILTDTCLAECIEKLGSKADLPSHDDLQAVFPELIDTHGRSTVQLMLASVVAGEAPASPTIIRILKHDEVLALPKVEPKPVAPLLPAKADDEERARLKEQRKARRAQEQAEARARREQAERARRG
jgi:hypothetical protein